MGNSETKKSAEHEHAPEKSGEKGEILNFRDAKEALVSTDRLQSKLLFALNKIKNHPKWQEGVVDGFWNKLSPKDRELLYKGGKPSLLNALKSGSPVFNQISSLLKYDDRRLKIFGNQMSQSTRTLVQLDLLPAPEGVPTEDITKDILKDKRNYKLLLMALQIIVSILAPEVAPEVQEVKKIASGLVDVKTELAKKQQELKRAA